MFIAALYKKSPKLGTAQIFINRRMDEQIVTYSYNGILLDSKKEWSANTQTNLINGIILWESITISIKISIKKSVVCSSSSDTGKFMGIKCLNFSLCC